MGRLDADPAALGETAVPWLADEAEIGTNPMLGMRAPRMPEKIVPVVDDAKAAGGARLLRRQGVRPAP